MTETFYVATLPHYTCGVIVADGRIIDTAPVARSWLGQRLETYAAWAERKGGRVELVADAVERLGREGAPRPQRP